MNTARALDFNSQDLSNTMWALPGSSSDYSSEAADDLATGAAHCLPSKQPAAAAAAATTTRVQQMPRPRGREAR
eukprot:12422182-Karenia_brevis.AAC.1